MSFFVKYKYYLGLLAGHILPIIYLGAITVDDLKYVSTSLYIFFMLIFALNVGVSLFNVVERRKDYFFYLLSILLTFGFPVKFSTHTILNYDYVEPVGSFVFDKGSLREVLLVASCGALGLLFSQIYSFFIDRKQDVKDFIKRDINYNKNNFKVTFALAGLAIVMSYLNLKNNILLFGLVPSIDLPFKGNVIYFLLLTRGVLFLMFYYCFKRLSYLTILFGAFITMVCSVGVLSRMIIILYFATIIVYLLSELKSYSFKKALVKTSFVIVIFSLFSYLTVRFSSQLREEMYRTVNYEELLENTRNISSEGKREKDKIEKYVEIYKNLVVDRWIGMEGVMAVQSYKKKEFSLLWDGFMEKSYGGHSYYTKIADPDLYQKYNSESRLVSTSVPGPIAFAYYSNSYIFVFAFMALTTLVFGLIANQFKKKFSRNHFVTIYISIFMVFDYFQFGISPSAFVKNWMFSFFCIGIFAYRSMIMSKILGLFRNVEIN